MNCFYFLKRAARLARPVFAGLILPATVNAQCPTVSHCFPGPGNSTVVYVFTPMNVTASNSVIIADSNPNDLTGPQVKSTDITCVLVGAVEKHVDMLVTVYDITPGISTGNFGPGFTGFSNGTISFLGDGTNVNRRYKFITQFFETGTSTPINITVLQQVQDIDGDGDWDGDGIRDDTRCNTPLVQVRDDYAWSRGFTASDTSDVTLIYEKTNGDTTFFFSSGTNNTSYTGISGRTPSPSTQAFLLAFTDKSTIEFGYAPGQYGGVFIDYTAQNLVVIPRCTTLPVTWVSFTGTEKDGVANLYWKVTNETDVVSYDIEKSVDGTRFIKTGSLDYHAGPGLDNDYKFSDHINNAGSTIVYYRIRQNDIDGKFSYSKVIAIRLNRADSEYSIFPNPVTDKLYINITSTNNQQGTIALYNSVGQIQHTQRIQLLKGNNAISINSDFATLPKGIYSVSVKLPGKTITEKLVKL